MSRFISLIVLLFMLPVCSCVKVSRQVITTSDVTSTSSANNSRPEAKRLNINIASAGDLESLPGVGKILAERIVAHREQYGPFRRVEHLMMVRGISDRKFRAIGNLVTVE